MNAPEFTIELQPFWKDPYPALAQMREHTPICFVPQLNATLLTLRDDIFVCEKNIEIFSSEQPDGLMTQLMGQNMMRKDGAEHLKERRDILPSVSPRAVKETWIAQFQADTKRLLTELKLRSTIDIVTDYAMPVSANALRHITGLTRMTPIEMDSVSQAMIDGISNYSGDPEIEQRCKQSTQLIDDHIDAMLPAAKATPSASVLSVLLRTDQPIESIRANIKLVISGGQNEPRDAIAGAVWALLTHPEQLQLIHANQASWHQAFEEYARWNSPIGMSPRRISKAFSYKGIDFEPESRAFLMFSSANRDGSHFENAEHFDITRNTSKAISFGAGPHFCAGAAASRALIVDVALPMLFEHFPTIKLASDIEMGGWAFRGPISVPVHI